MKKFLVNLTLFSAAIAAVALLLSLFLEEGSVNRVTGFLIIYFFIITFLFHLGAVKSQNKNAQLFVRYYQGAKLFKLLFHFAVILVYCITHRSDAVKFIVNFAVLYLLYSFFEAVASMRKFKKVV